MKHVNPMREREENKETAGCLVPELRDWENSPFMYY